MTLPISRATLKTNCLLMKIPVIWTLAHSVTLSEHYSCQITPIQGSQSRWRQLEDKRTQCLGDTDQLRTGLGRRAARTGDL